MIHESRQLVLISDEVPATIQDAIKSYIQFMANLHVMGVPL